MHTEITIACSADDEFAMPLAVTVHSLLANLGPSTRSEIYILDGGLTAANRRRVQQSAADFDTTLVWVDARALEDKCTVDPTLLSTKYPIANFYRMLLPDVLPSGTSRVIYLDTDLVVEGDLTDFWELDCSDAYVVAVQDPCHRFLGHTTHLDCERFGVDPEGKYFNAGVLLIDLDRWRSERIGEQAIELVNRHSDTILAPTQDPLNILFAGQWNECRPAWNQMHALHDFESWADSPHDEEAYREALEQPRIVHYTTSPKPWMVGCVNPERWRFYEYLDRTAWSGWRNTLWRRSVRRARRLLAPGRRTTRDTGTRAAKG